MILELDVSVQALWFHLKWLERSPANNNLSVERSETLANRTSPARRLRPKFGKSVPRITAALVFWVNALSAYGAAKKLHSWWRGSPILPSSRQDRKMSWVEA
jgi:hypothetical protein